MVLRAHFGCPPLRIISLKCNAKLLFAFLKANAVYFKDTCLFFFFGFMWHCVGSTRWHRIFTFVLFFALTTHERIGEKNNGNAILILKSKPTTDYKN